MVEIVEETDDNQSSSTRAGASASSSNQPQSAPQHLSFSQFVSTKTMECILFVSRILTVFFALNYMLPFTGFVAHHSAYYKVFVASAATFALRLHTRIQGQFSLNAQFIQGLVIEDAFHYLVYSVVFLMAAPVSMATVPVTIYAALHACTFVTKILRETGYNSSIVPKLELFLAHQTQNALGIIACSEIFLVPLIVSLVFSGKGSLLLPFAYYRFLSLRYASRRNPSTRQAFQQMRGSLTNVAQSPSCPRPISAFIYKTIEFISARAPPVM